MNCLENRVSKMARLVCNSSPIISLSMINQLSLLWQIFDEIYIPEEVYREVVEGNIVKKWGEEQLKEAVDAGSIRIYQVQNRDFIEQMYGRLHRGELEVIAAAKELGISWVCLDDKLARKLAETMLLKPIGVIGILETAQRMGKIINIKEYVDTMIDNGYRISKNIYHRLLDRSANNNP